MRATMSMIRRTRLVELRTFQDLAHGTEPTGQTTGYASTVWNYNPQRGWLDSKGYDDGKGPEYTYTPAGRLETRKWARTLADGTTKLTTTYTYDQGQMVGTTYNDGITESVVYAYDNFGRPTLVTQGTGANQNQHAYVYDPTTLVLETETVSYANGLSRTIDRSQDSLLRPNGFEVLNGQTVEHATSYGYDTAGRLKHVDSAFPLPASPEFTYNYLDDSGSLLESVVGPAHTVTNQYESTRNVLDVKSNETNGSNVTLVSAFDYTVNAIGQRDDVSRSGSAFASANTESWNYNAKGEVVTADHSANNAFDRSYEFDGMGNRLKSADSLTLPEADNYKPNALNQLEEVGGTARTYDDDGNLLDDGTRTYVWDAENRLIEVKDSSGSKIVAYNYDAYSRRIQKIEGSSVTGYLYDEWNLVVEYIGTTLSKSYKWGMDLSGSMQGAGGVGGLLSINKGSETYYPTFDVNGNVSEYIDATGTTVAHYEYDDFGRTVAQNGVKAADFTHRFSTKPKESWGEFYYYGYRYYDATSGRWLGRDPLGETAGLNVYNFISNDSINNYDLLGLIARSGMEEEWWYVTTCTYDLYYGKEEDREECESASGEELADCPQCQNVTIVGAGAGATQPQAETAAINEQVIVYNKEIEKIYDNKEVVFFVTPRKCTNKYVRLGGDEDGDGERDIRVYPYPEPRDYLNV